MYRFLAVLLFLLDQERYFLRVEAYSHKPYFNVILLPCREGSMSGFISRMESLWLMLRFEKR